MFGFVSQAEVTDDFVAWDVLYPNHNLEIIPRISLRNKTQKYVSLWKIADIVLLRRDK